MSIYIPVNNIAKSLSTAYIVGGVTKKISKAYTVVGGVRKELYVSDILSNPNTKNLEKLLLSNDDMIETLNRYDDICLFNIDLSNFAYYHATSNIYVTLTGSNTEGYTFTKTATSHTKDVWYKTYSQNITSGFFMLSAENVQNYGGCRPLVIGSVDTFSPTYYNQWTLQTGFELEMNRNISEGYSYCNYNPSSNNYYIQGNYQTKNIRPILLVYSNGKVGMASTNESGVYVYRSYDVLDISNMKTLAFGFAPYSAGQKLMLKSAYINFD